MDSKKDWAANDLLNIATDCWRACTIQAGVRLDIFTTIGKKNLRLHEISDKLKIDELGAEYLLNALSSVGLLIKKNNHYSNSIPAINFLSRESPEYIGHAILHQHHMLDGWVQLHEVVKKEGPVDMRSYGDDIEHESYLMGMFNTGMQIAPEVASLTDFSGRHRLLDLGGGPGAYAINFCLANPELSAVIYDLHSTKQFAMKQVEKFGLTDRIEFAGGDFNDAPITCGPYDIAWLSNVLHLNKPEVCLRIIKKTVEAMNPGGLIFIHDFILDNTKDSPEIPALFALHMLVATPSGRLYSEEEIGGMLEDVGVKNVAKHSFRGPRETSILHGTV